MLSALRPISSMQVLRYCMPLCSNSVRCLTNIPPPEKTEKKSEKFKPHEINGKFMSDDPKMSIRQRLKNLFTIYGPTAVVLHIALSLSFLGVTYMVVRYGFDVPSYLEKYGHMNEKYLVIIANSGTFGVAYALYKSLMPFRIMVTIFLTPKVARYLQRYGIIKRKF